MTHTSRPVARPHFSRKQNNIPSRLLHTKWYMLLSSRSSASNSCGSHTLAIGQHNQLRRKSACSTAWTPVGCSRNSRRRTRTSRAIHPSSSRRNRRRSRTRVTHWKSYSRFSALRHQGMCLEISLPSTRLHPWTLYHRCPGHPQNSICLISCIVKILTNSRAQDQTFSKFLHHSRINAMCCMLVFLRSLYSFTKFSCYVLLKQIS